LLAGKKARVPVPFDPDEAWGIKRQHHVSGTVAGLPVRVTVAQDDVGWSFSLDAARVRDSPAELGDDVAVVISPEGPQRGDLAPDLLAALDSNPAAGAFFDSLAQFYRKSYLRWIDGTPCRCVLLRMDLLVAMALRPVPTTTGDVDLYGAPLVVAS
jgi:hypothetical protein